MISILVAAFAIVVIFTALAHQAGAPERCPSCDETAVRAYHQVLSRPNPSPAYHRCEHCGLRLRRLFNGPWEDASATEFDRFYVGAPPRDFSVHASYRKGANVPPAKANQAGPASIARR